MPQVEPIVTTIFDSLIPSLDGQRLLSLLDFLNQQFFSRLDGQYATTVRATGGRSHHWPFCHRQVFARPSRSARPMLALSSRRATVSIVCAACVMCDVKSQAAPAHEFFHGWWVVVTGKTHTVPRLR